MPDGATVIFSAHGVSRAVQDEARRRGLRVFDATCPLVTKVHMEVARYGRDGRDVILIGHAGHPEVEGTMGQFDASAGGRIRLVENVSDVARLEVRDPARVGVVTQTTLSVDDTAEVLEALVRRFPTLATPRKEDICYATQNRQDAVKKLVEALRRPDRRRVDDQLEFEPAARDRRQGRYPRLSGRRPGRSAPGMVRGKRGGRRHRRRVGARAAGAAGCRAASGMGRPAGGRGRRPRGRRRLCPAEGTARSRPEALPAVRVRSRSSHRPGRS